MATIRAPPPEAWLRVPLEKAEKAEHHDAQRERKHRAARQRGHGAARAEQRADQPAHPVERAGPQERASQADEEAQLEKLRRVVAVDERPDHERARRGVQGAVDLGDPEDLWPRPMTTATRPAIPIARGMR